MSDAIERRSWRFCERARSLIAAATFSAAAVLLPALSYADEGGVSFWAPGIYGSLAAVPPNPGWSFSTVYYPLFVSATGGVAAQREFEIGRFTPTANLNLQLKVKVHGSPDLLQRANSRHNHVPPHTVQESGTILIGVPFKER